MAEHRYPNHINSATAVPAWAYLDVVTPDQFLLSGARRLAVAGLPESTVGNNEVSTSSSTSPLTTTQASTTTPVGLNSSSPSNSSGPSNNTYTLIGVAVGGIIGASLLAGLVLYLRQRNKINKTKRRVQPAVFPSVTAALDGPRAESVTVNEKRDDIGPA